MPKTATPSLSLRLLLTALILLAAFYANWRGWEWAGRLQRVDFADAASHAALPDRVASVSFAPFRRGQSPLTRTYPTREEIDEDLKAAAIVARGVRTYTSREGLQAVPELAGKYGLDVIHSAWLGREPEINEAEVAALIEQANRHPDTIKRVIVGNEVLLRKDLTVDQLIQQIRRVKAAVKQPVSYADVWEFWLRYPQLLNEVDFVTVHFLPYWEDIPIGVEHAMPHIKAVMDQVRAGLPGKPILVGEVGWPSLGRSRREAIPSRPEAARFNLEFLRLAEKEGFDYNIVEAFDQSWKARLEGTVGGAWGLLDEDRQPKFGKLGDPVSDLPEWRRYAMGAGLLAIALLFAQRRRLFAGGLAPVMLAALAAQGAGAALAATLEHGLSHAIDWVRWTEFILAFAAQALCAHLVLGRLLAKKAASRASEQAALHLLFGGFALYMLYQTAMLVFMGRYRDFPVDYALLPAAGFWLLLALGHSPRLRLLPDTGYWEAFSLYYFVILGGLLVAIERVSNCEALYWSALAAAYALPIGFSLIRRRRAGADKAIAEPAASG